MQVGKDRTARVLQLLGQLAGRESSGTVIDQVTNRGGQTAVFGKANGLMVPNPLPVKLRETAEGVPLAVMGIAAVIAQVVEEAAHRNEGITEGLSQGSQHPTGAALEELLQAVRWGGEGWHGM